MREQNSNTNEYEPWDDGTYQTGPSKPPKGQSGLITLLLMAVILLGGLTSALGVMNFRLLSQLMAQNQQTAISLEGTQATDDGQSADVFHSEQQTVLPEQSLSLTFGQEAQQALTEDQLLRQSLSCTLALEVRGEDGLAATGMALVVSPEGYLVTNARLADSGDSFTVTLSDGQALEAVLIASDVYADVALLYVQAEGLQAAEFAEATQTQVYISEDRKMVGGSLKTDGFARSSQLMQTDLQQQSGPVFNAGGQVVGLLCRALEDSQAQGLLLSSRDMEDILTQLAQKGAVTGHPSLGFRVKELTELCRQYWELSGGVQVSAVTDPDQGLQEGDILLAVDGQALTDTDQLYALIGSADQGQVLEIELLRSGCRFTLALTVQWNE